VNGSVQVEAPPMRVGVIPNAPDFDHPADRRRYMFYFRRKGIDFETADPSKFYDAVYISLTADLNEWRRYKALHPRSLVVLDLSDSYLVAGAVSDTLRSIFHYFSRRTRTLRWSYKRTLLEMMAASDVILCGSEEQKGMLGKLHPNVHVMRDFYGLDLSARKLSYHLSSPRTLNVLWEGFAHGNVRAFEMLRDLLATVDGFRVKAHIVTDSRYCRFGGGHLCKATYQVLEQVFRGSRVGFHLYDWNALTFSAIATRCDLAVIPVQDDPIAQSKPENKLLLMWSMGLPVVTSNTASYARVMKSVGADLACAHLADWREKIGQLASSEEFRVSHMQAAARYVADHCSEDAISKTWDSVFQPAWDRSGGRSGRIEERH
jgi:hypothetical protein